MVKEEGRGKKTIRKIFYSKQEKKSTTKYRSTHFWRKWEWASNKCRHRLLGVLACIWIWMKWARSDEWSKQKIILWVMSDEGRRSYYEGWMMKAEDHIMNDKTEDEWWMMKEHIMRDERWWKQKIILWIMNDECKRYMYKGLMTEAEDHLLNDA